MKKAIYSLCALCMALALVLIPISTLDAFALNADAEPKEDKIICTATIEDEFTDDKVAVVIKNEYSLKFKKYKVSDFANVGCINVRDLSTEAAENIQEHQGHICDVATQQAKDYHQILCIELKDKGKENVLAAIKELEKRDDILTVAPNYIIEGEGGTVADEAQLFEVNKVFENALSAETVMPDDTELSRQWAINKIQLPQAWNYTTGSNDLVVGVIDSGVDYTHPELQGKIDTSLSYDFINDTSAMPDSSSIHYHGTFISRIIAANTNNGVGVAGVCWNIKIASLRVLNQYNRGSWEDLADAINDAQSKGISIINLSIGGRSTSDMLLYAIQNYTGVIVCAAGNDHTDNDNSETPNYPSNYNYRNNLISVGASDENDECYINYDGRGSNYGKTKVDLFAPGINIYSTIPDGGYLTGWGTSYAAPYVTGVAALIKSYYPTMPAAQIKTAIKNGVDKLSSLSDYCVTGGRLNAYKAIANANHSHSYSFRYKYASATQHYSYCECGEYIFSPHSARASSIVFKNGHNYATCISCLRQINIDDNPIYIINGAGVGELESMGLIVIADTKQLEKELLSAKRTELYGNESLFNYYDDAFFEKYVIVVGDDCSSISEKLYSNIIINFKESIDNCRHMIYNENSNCSEAYV